LTLSFIQMAFRDGTGDVIAHAPALQTMGTAVGLLTSSFARVFFFSLAVLARSNKVAGVLLFGFSCASATMAFENDNAFNSSFFSRLLVGTSFAAQLSKLPDFRIAVQLLPWYLRNT
jgi:hypothetical protein